MQELHFVMPADPDHPFPKKRILFAPLNWGLGHVSRCIPLIQHLEKAGVDVILASDGVAQHLLKAEFPHLTCLTLPSYKIRYFSNNMVLNIARQLPRMLYAIRSEQWATEKIIREYGICGIISDNRYGCFSTKVKSVILTHQLNLRIPNRVLQWGANQVLYKMLTKFDAVWVPDIESSNGLSAALAHPAGNLKNVTYIGLLSRAFAPTPVTNFDYDVAVILSGPEPQRTYLEQVLLEQAMSLPHKFIFVQGKTKTKKHHYEAPNIEVVSFLTSEELNKVLAASRYIVCRSGYSSLMDLVGTGKRGILIPTPGQTEQEYLAENLRRENLFIVQKQPKINLGEALHQVKHTLGFNGTDFTVNTFQAKLDGWLQRLTPVSQ
ncbi:MAG: glycosyl transferase family 28 [Saprospiraceae bacterium]|nr:glycosyl transferase family 28 [Saprospiraceae bacterium]